MKVVMEDFYLRENIAKIKQKETGKSNWKEGVE